MQSKVQRESSLIAEGVERFTVRVLGGGGIVFALVEEGAGFLALEAVVVKSYPVHSNFGRTLLPPKQAGRERRQLFQFSNARIDALDDSGGVQFVA